MTEPIQVPTMGEPELPPETVTERKLEEIIQGSRVIHARHQGFTKAMARKLLAVMQENAKLREALRESDQFLRTVEISFNGSFDDTSKERISLIRNNRALLEAQWAR
jgi:hypothetical protein